MKISQFSRTSPSKLFDRALKYSKRLGHYHDLPKNISKSMVVRQQANRTNVSKLDQKDEIDFTIKRSRFQLELYRKKENEDMLRRTSFEKKLITSAEKVAKNQKAIESKKSKVAELYNRHLKDIYKKYEQDERKSRQRQKETSYKLRKQIKEFYQKEAERKKSGELGQIHVATCYQGALDKIDGIHRRNEEYSEKAQRNLNTQLQKNSHLDQVINKKRSSLSSINREKSKIYERNLSIFQKRENAFVNKYGENEDLSLSAFKHIEQEGGKTKKRLNQFFNHRAEKWSYQKKRIDNAKAEISKRCSGIMERTNNSLFRQSVSSFRGTSKQWQKIVQKNKSAIRDQDQMKKDEIMETHLDVRLRNTSSLKVTERMSSMRRQAKKLASEYL